MDAVEDSTVEEEEEGLCYRQRAEKSTGGEMRQMQWSPTQDLLAAAFADNSVRKNNEIIYLQLKGSLRM